MEIEIGEARKLFEEYAASLDFSLCFQGFTEELAGLPGGYAPPAGRLFLAWLDGRAVGCVAFRKFNSDTAELKRLYVRPEGRGGGLWARNLF
ncbi:MAG TPA: GNAT family N-acetyltransferase [Terriglobia bacterium]|nr:GNAT family N-acetyltransferase [Terriglobia bacterium]